MNVRAVKNIKPRLWEAPVAIVLSVLLLYSGPFAAFSPLPLLLFGLRTSRRIFYPIFFLSIGIGVLLPYFSLSFVGQPLQLLAWGLFTVLYYEAIHRDLPFSTTLALLTVSITIVAAGEIAFLIFIKKQSLDAVILQAFEFEKIRSQLAPGGFIGSIDFVLIEKAISFCFFGLIFGFWFAETFALGVVLRSVQRTHEVAELVRSGLPIELIQKQKGLSNFSAGNLMTWSGPEWSIYFLVVALFLVTLQFFQPFQQSQIMVCLARIGSSVAVGLCFIYFIQGIAVLIYYLNRIKVGFIAAALLVLIVFQLNFLILIVGIFDNWFNLRRLQGNRAPSAKF